MTGSRSLNLTSMAVSILLAVTSLSGCARESIAVSCDSRTGKSSSNVSREVALVLAPTSNFINIQNVLAESEALLAELLNHDGTKFSIVLADSTPSIVSKEWVDFSEAAFEPDRIEIVDRAINSINWAASCSTGARGSTFEVDPEVDFLKSLQIASDTFTSKNSEKYLIILGNGIQTSGQLRMQEGFPSDIGAGESIGPQLKESGSLGDMQGATVTWFGFGQVNELQPQPNQLSKDILVALWQGIVNSSGGKVGSIAPGTAPSSPPENTSIEVSPISWVPDACVSITLGSETGFSFERNVAIFIDIDKAREGAKSVVAQVEASDCSGTVTVTGYTASGTDKEDYLENYERISVELQALSLARANAFAALLREAGLTDAIEVVGAGKGPLVDWDASGNLVEDLAAVNRKVVVTQK